MDVRGLMSKAAELRAKMAQLAPAVAQFKELEFDLKLVKQEILGVLNEQGSRGTDYIEGVRATKGRTSLTLKILDPEAFREFLDNNTSAEQMASLLTVDKTAATKFAKEYQDKVGRAPEGTELERTEYIRFEEEKPELAALGEDINPLD